MFRRGLSGSFLVIVALLFLVACRRDADVGLPTPVETDAGVTFVPPADATAMAATSTIAATPNGATALPGATATPTPVGTATPLRLTAAPSHTPAGSATTVGSATQAPPPTAPPTVSAGPPPGGSARINFAPGATSATVSSTLAAGGDGDTWLLRVSAGQVITVQTIANPAGQMNVQLLDANGGFLAGNVDTVGISAAASTTGDYQINLATTSGAPAVAYTLQVIVPPAAGPVTPQRIQFAPGQSSAQVQDSLAAGGDLNSYVINVAAGQTIQVGVFASPPAATNVTIRNAAGQTLTSGTDMSGASATAATTGDYFIDVSNFNAAPTVSYTLTVTVPPLTTPPTVAPATVAPPPQQRITFGPGQFSAELSGAVFNGGGAQYVLAAAAGQTLIADLNDNPPGNVEITILDPNNSVVNFGRAPTSLGTQLPLSGDYRINLSTTAAGPVNFTLRVTVPPLPRAEATRIEFGPGATSATVQSDLPFGGDQDTWLIRGLAGQTLHVSVGVVETTGWTRVFIYDAAGQIVGLGSDITGASAPLIATGDYRIVVVSDPAAGPLSYSLTAAIP
jgi:hypothetical protein